MDSEYYVFKNIYFVQRGSVQFVRSYLRYLRIVVSNTYCVVFLICLSSSSVPYAASFSGLLIFYCLFGIL